MKQTNLEKNVNPITNYITKIIKNISKDENKTMMIGLLSILLFLWLVLYIIPEFFNSLFNTILGNFILLTISILTISNNIRYGICLTIIFIIISRFVTLSKEQSSMLNVKEGFIWNKDSTTKFLQIQSTINRNIIFDPSEIEQQASQKELDYFLQNGMWPWSQEVQDLYKDALMNNPYVRSDVQSALNQARTIYNESIILEMLSWQTKEGVFLLRGIQINDPSNNSMVPAGSGSYGYNSGLITNMYNPIIKCEVDNKGNNVLTKHEYTGDDKTIGLHMKKSSPIDYNQLEILIPGFSFMNEPCNPCQALNKDPLYTCHFKLDLSGNQIQQGEQPDSISLIWQYLWGINTDTLKSR